MKNLESFGLQELTITQMNEVNGGGFWRDFFKSSAMVAEKYWEIYGESIKEGFYDFWSIP